MLPPDTRLFHFVLHICNLRRSGVHTTLCAGFSPSLASNTAEHYLHVLLFLLREVYVFEGRRTARSREACALCTDMLSAPPYTPHSSPPLLISPLLPPAAIAMRQPDQRGAALKKTILTQHRRSGDLCVLSAQTRRCSRRHMLTRSALPWPGWLRRRSGDALLLLLPCTSSSHGFF